MTPSGGQEWFASDGESPAEQIDSVAPWLLRLGIDARGQLTAGPPWDIGIRAAVLVDLRLTERIVDSDTTTYIDEPSPDGEYEDVACDQLLHGGFDTETAWIDRGRLRVCDVAQRLVAAGEWTVKSTPLRPGGRTYRAPQDSHLALRAHLRDVGDGHAARSPQEFATLVLADQLFGLAGGSGALELRWDECGPYRDLVKHASIRIRTRAAMAQLGASGGGG
jgi:hypothetical protein